jgi:hypothetical protein
MEVVVITTTNYRVSGAAALTIVSSSTISCRRRSFRPAGEPVVHALTNAAVVERTDVERLRRPGAESVER